jgi:hypothetical protein
MDVERFNLKQLNEEEVKEQCGEVFTIASKPLKHVYSEREIGGPEKDRLSRWWRRALKRTC